jgi:serine/threonine protein kinase
MAVSSTQFLKHLEASGLVEAETLSAARMEARKSKTDGRALAAYLVQKQKLTAYQAKQILAGNSRGFFLEKYKILEPLGRGGMGLVFKAEHTMLGRVAAIKVLPRKAAADRESVTRFRREACATAQLEHENIVRVYDVGQQGEAHFIAMEFVPGQSLSKAVKGRGRLAVREAVSIIYQVALGLEHAYRRGITHRDIKPSNILVTPEGKAKILDMGLARVFGLTAEEAAGQASLTMSGTVVGTVDYVAPEQADDSHKADVRSDIYSLGCTLYECLTGRVPFPGGTMMQKLMRHYKAEPTAIAELAPDVPEGLVAVVRRLMAKQPGDRFQSPGEVAQVLLPFLAPSLTGQAAESSIIAPVAIQQPASTPRAVSPGAASFIAPGDVDAPAQTSRPTLPTIPLGTRSPLDKAEPAGPAGSAAVPDATPVAAGTPPAVLANSDTQKDPGVAAVKRSANRAPSMQQRTPRTPIVPKPAKVEVAQATGQTPAVAPATKQTQPIAKPKTNGTATQVEPDINDILEAIAAAASESPPSAVAVRPSHPASRYRSAWIGGAAVMAIIAVAGVYWVTSRNGILVLKYPEAYSADITSPSIQEHGRIVVDGQALLIPEQFAGEIPIRSGRRQLVVELPGLKPVNRLVSVAPGARLPVELKPTDQKLREWELKNLKARVAAAAGRDPNDAVAKLLRETLTAFATKNRGTEEFAIAMKLRGGLRWPADRLQELATPQDLISAPNATDSSHSQVTVVARLPSTAAGQGDNNARLAFSPDGRFLARGCTTGKVELWDLSGEPNFRTIGDHGSPVILTAFTADGQSVVSVSKDKIKLWNSASGSQQSEFEGLKGQVTCAAQSLDCRRFACAFSDGQVAVYDVRGGGEPKQLRGVATPVLSLALAPDGEVLALGSKDKVEIWNVRTALRIRSLGASQEVVALAFSPDSQLLSKVGRSGSAKVWKAGIWQAIGSLQKDRDLLAFGPDGRIAAVVTRGRKVEFIHTQSGGVQCAVEFNPTVGPVCQLAFGPDGRHVASAHSDGGVCVLRLIPTADSTQTTPNSI